MKAIDLKMGDTFRRTAASNVHTVAIVKDLDPDGNQRPLLRDKLEVTTTENKTFWMRKDERVSLVQTETPESHG